MNKYVDWNEEKNEELKLERGVSFEEIVVAMESKLVLDIISNPNHSNQKLMIINLDNYAYAIPYVEDEKKLFLKTIYPSRKYTKLYLNRKDYI